MAKGNIWEISCFGWHNISGVYAVCEIIDNQNHVLYIGSSSDIGARLKNHNHPYRKLFSEGRSVYIKFKETSDFKRLEKDLIQRLCPPLNIVYNGQR